MNLTPLSSRSKSKYRYHTICALSYFRLLGSVMVLLFGKDNPGVSHRFRVAYVSGNICWFRLRSSSTSKWNQDAEPEHGDPGVADMLSTEIVLGSDRTCLEQAGAGRGGGVHSFAF